MTKNAKVFILQIVFWFNTFSIFNIIVAQDRNVTVSVGYGSYTYFKSTWFQQHFKNSATNFPSVGFDIALSNLVSLNSSVLYVTHTSDMYYGGTYYSNNGGYYNFGMVNYHTVLKELFLFPKVQLNLIEKGLFVVKAGVGPMMGYVYEKNLNLNEFYEFIVFGGVGGFTISNQIENTPLRTFVNIDAHYAYRGKKSLLQEYGGYLINIGIGLDL